MAMLKQLSNSKFIICTKLIPSRISANRLFQTYYPTCDSFNVQDNEDFKKRVLKSSIPVIADFHADWCGPCKLLAPRLESISDTYQGKIHLAKINIDNNTELAIEYGVDAVPCVIGFKQGKQVDKFVGLRDDDVIQNFIEKIIGPKTD